ncbi:MAG TPA: FAD-dependent monooxygenase [Candidatus Sulfotelmatobacter sp.]|nr:FAD-dependent monooxygenase [Candidatus Sulfotelmatobacter sp.]
MPANRGAAIVVGGSLVGLPLAIALARRGIAVTVLEQTVGDERGGAGLGVERDLYARLAGVDPRTSELVPAMPVIRTSRETSTWYAIRSWLLAVVARTPGIEIHAGRRVVEVRDGAQRAVARTLDGTTFEADVVLGADGYRSVVRAAVDPARQHARYGGFVLWRGLPHEAWLPEAMWRARQLGGGRQPIPETARLVAYHVPGPHGETAPGSRQITFAWYDGSRTAWLRERGLLVGDEVRSSVTLDDTLRAELRAIAPARWPGTPAAAAIVAALDRNVAFGTPLAEYLPERLASGRVAMLGDAAHVSSPMVGAGLITGLLDALAIATYVDDEGGVRGAAGARALRRYQTARLDEDREQVQVSMDATRDLLRTARVRDS